MRFYAAPLPADRECLTIVSTGYARLEMTRPDFRRHGWKYYQLMFTILGEGRGDVEGRQFRGFENSIWIMPKDKDHGYYKAPEADVWEYRWIEFDGEMCPQLLRMLGLEGRHHVRGCDRARPILEEIVALLEAHGNGALHEAAALFFQLLVSMEKTMRLARAEEHMGSRINDRLRRYFNAHLAENIQLRDAADEIGLSSEHMIREFKRSNGISPMQYLRELRINRAKALLHDGALNISEVGQAVGYNSLPHFSRVFRQSTGMSPRTFRRRAGLV